MGILPEIIDFGDPDFDVFPDTIPVELSEADQTPSPLPAQEEPFGVDLKFDFYESNFVMTPSGDFRFTTEKKGLEQWVAIALLTPRGQEILYTPDFGTTLTDIIGENISEVGLSNSLRKDIEEAIFLHDRIDKISVFAMEEQGDVMVISFDVITDDHRVLSFEGVQIAR